MTSVAKVLVPVCGLLTLLPFVTAPVGLLLGLALALTMGNPHAAVTKKATTLLLQGSVIGLGFGMDLRVVLRVGAEGLVSTVLSIALCFAAGLLLTRALRVRRDAGVLITTGTAICGGSAIAAAVPAIGADDEDASVALVTVFLLNSVALFVFPFLGHAAQLDESKFGLWAALAIHDTSSVVGAASQYGKRALEIATTVKLARALWIAPVALALGAWRRANGSTGAGRAGAKPPWFIMGFLIAAAAATFIPGAAPWGGALARVARQSLVLTLFLIGAGFSRASLRKVGFRPFLLGVLLWLAMGFGTLGAIVWL